MYSGPRSSIHPPPYRLPFSTDHRARLTYQPRKAIVRVNRRWREVGVAHEILTQAIDAVLHVQLFDARRDLSHHLVVLLRLECPGRRPITIHGCRDMHANGVYAVQSMEDFRP